MHISRVQIRNFRNFGELDVSLSPNALIIGENRVGKSNFLHALRLVLDASLPDSARLLKLSDIWDQHVLSSDSEVFVHIDFSGFDADPGLTALLTDYRLSEDHTIARLSYVFRKKDEVAGVPQSEADFDFKVYGANDETRSISPAFRRRVCLTLMHALRDAEAELGAWRSSPLRPLFDDAVSRVQRSDLESVATEVSVATSRITNLAPILDLEKTLRERTARLAGPVQDLQAKLGIAPTDPLRLLRSIRVLIDEGKRAISDASLGSANILLLTLKLLELEWLREKNAHNFTLVCVEEPEAHLHPHSQRTIFAKLFEEIKGQPISLFMTTHSPNIASVAPLHSVVLLKSGSLGTRGYSLAGLALSSDELEDLQRYIDVSRAEVFFSRAVVFVEGDAEEALIPVFARSVGMNLDEKGIAVCNVGGTNFEPYVRLAAKLSLPFCVITDWDPVEKGQPLGIKRSLDLLDVIRRALGGSEMKLDERLRLASDESALRLEVEAMGVFLNHHTLEVDVAGTPTLRVPLLEILEEAQFGPTRRERIAAWKKGERSVDGEQLLAMVADVGKGRLAARLAGRISGFEPPKYIHDALTYLAAYG